jgi:hypothetical protein
MTDVLDMLKQADPVQVERLRAEPPPLDMLEAILAAEPAKRVPRRGGNRRRALALAGGVAAAALALVLVVGGRGESVDTAAAAALREIASAARSHPEPARPAPGQFLHRRIDGIGVMVMGPERPFRREIHSRADFGFRVQFRHSQDMWEGPTGGRVRNFMGDFSFPADRDRRAWIDAGRPALPPGGTDESDLGIDGTEWIDIPTEPDALLAKLQHDAEDGDHGPGYIFGTLIEGYLREVGTTRAQRAALFEVAARLPGIALLGRRTDRDGRTGIGFAMDDEDGNRTTLIVDPESGHLLASSQVTLPGGAIPAGTVVADATFQPPVVVDALGERP